MASYEKIVRRILLDNNCYLMRKGKGDHEIWYSPLTDKPITVDGVIKSRHSANGILKQAGINKKI